MNRPINESEKQALFDKRQTLFSLLQESEATLGPTMAPVPPQPHQPAQPAPAQGPADEVQDMLRKFVNPNADRWSLF